MDYKRLTKNQLIAEIENLKHKFSGIEEKNTDKNPSVKSLLRNLDADKISNERLVQEEEKYRTLTQNLNVAIYRTTADNKGTFIEVNPALVKMFGYQNKKELFTFNVSDLYANPKDRIAFFNTIQKKGFVKNRQIKFKKKNGEYFIGEISTVVIKDEDNNPIYYDGIIEDVTDRLKTEQIIKEKEEQYRTLFDFSPNGIVLEDRTGAIIDANKGFCKMMGYSYEELIGKKIHILAHPDVKENVDRNIGKILKGKKLRHIEKSIKKDGSHIYMELNESKFILPNGQSGIICIAEDITERKKIEENLLISEESYKGLFNNATDTIYIQDKSGKFVDVNKGAVKMYGYPRKYFIGKTPEFLAAPGKNDLNETKFKIKKAFEGEPQLFEFWGIDKNGRIFPKEVRLNKGLYFGKEVVIAFAQDISERKKALEALRESQRQISTLMGNLPGMAYRCLNDKDWTMEFVSEGSFKLTGYHPDEIVLNNKFSFNDLIHKTDQKPVWDEVQAALKLKKAFQLTYRIQTKKGKEKWVWEQGIGIYDNDQNLIALEGFISDISKIRLAEEEIRKLSRSVKQSPNIVVITDLKGDIEYVNPRFTKVTGYSKKEVIGKNPRILKSGKTSIETYTSLWGSITAGLDWSGELLNKKKNGDLYWEFAHIFPLKDKNRNITHFIGMKEDVTTRKKMEQELIDAKEKAEESDKLKSAFLANMSHEIRTPMNAIIGFSQLLNDPDLTTEEFNHFVSLIQNSGNDLLGLIDDIIDISKIEAGQIKIFKSQYFIDNVLLEIYDSYQEFLKTKENKKQVLLKYNKPLHSEINIINTDIDRFKQILRNLLNNAIKFTDSGLVEFGYEVIFTNKNPKLQFYVGDTGIGIQKEKLDVIFESFRQANLSDTKLYGGTGLGLAITKRTVEILGGEIWVKSTPGQGSTFYFTLPYQPTLAYHDLKHGELRGKKRKQYNWENKHLLIVEDDDQSFVFINQVLKKTKVNITRAVDGAEAVKLCNSHFFNLVLMDIRLPKMNGYTSTQKIKKRHPELKIIAQTAYAIEGEKERSLEAGCDDYITKPIEIDELYSIIHKHMV